MARPRSAQREEVWDMAIEQFVSPHCGVHTNRSTVFSHVIPEVWDFMLVFSVYLVDITDVCSCARSF